SRLRDLRVPDVAERGDRGPGGLLEEAGQESAAGAAADERDVHPLVRAPDAPRGQGGAGQDRSRPRHELPPLHGFLLSGAAYQFVIEPSGLRNKRTGWRCSVNSARSFARRGSNSTPSPGRSFGQSLPFRKSECWGKWGSGPGASPRISMQTGPGKEARTWTRAAVATGPVKCGTSPTLWVSQSAACL